jgi:adenylyl- and sulfurtransferase ThiI
MANTASQRQFLAVKLEALTESEVSEVLDYISGIESMRRSKTAPLVLEDELLAALADARENRRARQAFEWESVRRKAEKRAAARVGAYS